MSNSLLKEYASKIKEMDWSDDMVRRNPLYYRRLVKQLQNMDAASLEERKVWLENRVRIVLEKASRTKYGKKIGGKTHFFEWPVLEKELVRKDPGQFLAYPKLLTSQASTSGTTGTPLKLYRSPLCIIMEQACIDYVTGNRNCNIRNIKAAVLRGDFIKNLEDVQPPFWKYSVGNKRLILSSNHLTKFTVEHYENEIARYAPKCLLAYPTSLESLCGLLLSMDKKLHIPFVVTSSEVLSPRARELAYKALGCELIDYYGQAERIAFAYSYKKGEYYFLPGYSHLELEYSSSEKEADLYEIIGTPLWNLAMPLVRYRTGDLIRVMKGSTPSDIEKICYGVAPFRGIVGRINDYLVSPDGAKLKGIGYIPRDIDNIIQMQVIQEKLDEIRLLIVKGTGFSQKDRENILVNARKKIPKSMKVTLEIVDQLIRTKEGKSPFIIRNRGIK